MQKIDLGKFSSLSLTMEKDQLKQYFKDISDEPIGWTDGPTDQGCPQLKLNILQFYMISYGFGQQPLGSHLLQIWKQSQQALFTIMELKSAATQQPQVTKTRTGPAATQQPLVIKLGIGQAATQKLLFKNWKIEPRATFYFERNKASSHSAATGNKIGDLA